MGDQFAGNEWSDQPPLRDGDPVRLRGFFASSWVPKLPGRLWTAGGQKEILKGEGQSRSLVQVGDTEHLALDPYGKSLVLSGGYGSVQASLDVGTQDNYSIFSAVSHDAWHCDYGIPVIVSERVFNAINAEYAHGAPEVDIEGICVIGHNLPLRSLIPTAIGAELSDSLIEALRACPFLPKCYVYVGSPLSVTVRANQSHPPIVAWTSFASRSGAPHSTTFARVDEPLKTEALREAADFLTSYVRRYGSSIITDFDGREPKLQSDINLNTIPRHQRSAREVASQFFNRTTQYLREKLIS